MMPIKDLTLYLTEYKFPISSYKKGMVADLEASPAEKYWSVNIKRAILNILKVDLKTSDPSMSGKMPGLSEMLANMAPEVKLATGKVLRSMEVLHVYFYFVCFKRDFLNDDPLIFLGGKE